MIRRSRPVLFLSILALVGGCAESDPTPTVAAGSYVLDRADYARGLVRSRHPDFAQRSAAQATEAERKALAADVEAARRAAGVMELQLDLVADGTFVVTYRFPGERGRGRGAWTQAGDRLTLRITRDAAGPVERGAEVEARVVPEGIRFADWPVPNAFLLRPK